MTLDDDCVYPPQMRKALNVGETRRHIARKDMPLPEVFRLVITGAVVCFLGASSFAQTTCSQVSVTLTSNRASSTGTMTASGTGPVQGVEACGPPIAGGIPPIQLMAD